MITGPQYDFSEREMKLLRDFWEKQGRILLLLDPGAKTPKLNAFLYELGVKVNDDRLMAMVKTGIEEVGLFRDVCAIPGRQSDHQAPRGGAWDFPRRLLFAQPRAGARPGRECPSAPLVQAEKGYWAEADYNSGDQAKFQDDAAQWETPFTIAVSIEKGGSADERVQANSSRMVVVSNATFIQDNAITQDQQALDFISGAVNWLLNREQLIGIAPKVPQTLTFSLDEKALRNLRWLILLLAAAHPGGPGFGRLVAAPHLRIREMKTRTTLLFFCRSGARFLHQI